MDGPKVERLLSAAPWKESVVQVLQVSVTLAILAGAVAVVYALRSRRAST